MVGMVHVLMNMSLSLYRNIGVGSLVVLEEKYFRGIEVT